MIPVILSHTLSCYQRGMPLMLEEKRNCLTTTFVSVVTDVNYEIFEPTASQLTGNIKLEISKEMLERELRLINASKSRGPDNLQPVIFRETSYSLSKSLKLLFDNIIRLAKFPEAWKHGLVSPI